MYIINVLFKSGATAIINTKEILSVKKTTSIVNGVDYVLEIGNRENYSTINNVVSVKIDEVKDNG